MNPLVNPLPILETGEISFEGQFLWGSNYTLLVSVACDDGAIKAVYKPTQGVRPLWDFDAPTLARREVTAYLVSEQLGWRLVPPTIYRASGPLGPGSLQLFIEHDPDLHFFNFEPEERQRLRPAALFDVLINNADRKGGHFIIDRENHVWLIDHGICFHEDPKLRTVLWDFAGETIPDHLAADIGALRSALAAEGEFVQNLRFFLTDREIAALSQRAERLLRRNIFPAPPKNVRPYPWPLV